MSYALARIIHEASFYRSGHWFHSGFSDREEYGLYFRVKKIRCGIKGQVRGRCFHELCGLGTRLMLILACMFLTTPVLASTWYVRTDGGTPAQCTGMSDQAYSGSGVNGSCALKHPFYILPPSGLALMAGVGDTLVINAGNYRMGVGAPGAGVCNENAPWNCTLGVPPSGTASMPTRIQGKTNSQGSCISPPVLWGTARAKSILSLSGVEHVNVSCIEITDRSNCIDFAPTRTCKRDRAPYGHWASIGLKLRDSNNIVVEDVNIHGLANTGILGGNLRNVRFNRVRINGNGWSGLDWDLSPDPSSNSGTFFFDQVEIGYNGCGEGYPNVDDRLCWAQTQGGYGDGFGSATTGGRFVIRDSYIHHNTSDGFDFLYGNRTAKLEVSRSRFVANAGNQLKSSGNTTIDNSLFVGQCAYFEGQRYMGTGDHCRARGNALSLSFFKGSKVSINHSTITSEGDCLIVTGCRDNSCDGSEEFTVTNSVLLGKVDRYQPTQQSCLHYSIDLSQNLPRFDHNVIYAVKNNACPGGTNKCTSPKLVDERLATFNGQLRATSPALDAANVASTTTYDISKRKRPVGNGPDIGAYEFGIQAVPSVALVVGQIDSGRYGWRYGSNQHRDKVRMTFNSDGTDLLLSLRGFDIDSSTEAQLWLNDVAIGSMRQGRNNRHARPTLIVINRGEQASGQNVLEVRQSRPGWKYGITGVSLISLQGPVITLQSGVKNRQRFGYNYNGVNSHPVNLESTFSWVDNAATLSVRGYDIDSADEVEVLLNGTTIGALKQTANNAESVTRFDIPTTRLKSSNTLEFRQKTPGFRWGVRNVFIRPAG